MTDTSVCVTQMHGKEMSTAHTHTHTANTCTHTTNTNFTVTNEETHIYVALNQC